MSKIREMVDVNTVVGQPISTPDGVTVIPVSRVSFGGGSGAGVNITPIAFLVLKDGNVRLINVSPHEHTAIDNIIDMVPEVVDKLTGAMSRKKEAKAEDVVIEDPEPQE